MLLVTEFQVWDDFPNTEDWWVLPPFPQDSPPLPPLPHFSSKAWMLLVKGGSCEVWLRAGSPDPMGVRQRSWLRTSQLCVLGTGQRDTRWLAPPLPHPHFFLSPGKWGLWVPPTVLSLGCVLQHLGSVW